MDTLSNILNMLNFNGVFYYATDFNGPWSIQVPAYRQVVRFHYVVQGHCWVRMGKSEKPKLLTGGDIVIIPHGQTHVLSDSHDTAPISAEKAMAQANYDGNGIFRLGDTDSSNATKLVCGHFEFDEEFKHPLIESLPNVISCNENAGIEYSWLKDSLHFLSHVAQSEQMGAHSIIKRLSEIIFIQSVRYWHQNNARDVGFIAALQDTHLAKGLQLFHQDYAQDWTVEKLASASGMSRSLFSERFKTALGMTPMAYVTQWRMQVAKKLLNESALSIDHVAAEVGYESLASFSKAFKRITEINPGEFRRKTVQRAKTQRIPPDQN